MMNILRQGRITVGRQNQPCMEYIKRGPFCTVDFNVPVREGLHDAIKDVYDMYERIMMLSNQIDNLYKETERIRSLLEIAQEHKRIYMISDMKVYPSFVEIAGTWEQVNEKIKRYSDELNEKYYKPKTKLEYLKDDVLLQFHERLSQMGWRVEHVFSMSDDAHTISIRG